MYFCLFEQSEISFSMEQGPDGLDMNTQISSLAVFATTVSNLRNTATKVSYKGQYSACMVQSMHVH